jgi:ribonuclease HI
VSWTKCNHSCDILSNDVKNVTIHSDGACEGNPGPGGWASILAYGSHFKEISGSEPATTNNRMELKAAIESLRALKEPCSVEFFTDSEYLRKGVTEWLKDWKARNWKTADKKRVKNEDLWRELDTVAITHRVVWHWLKGHAGHEKNERCDLLARQEIAKLRQKFTPEQLVAFMEEFRSNSGDGQSGLSLLV